MTTGKRLSLFFYFFLLDLNHQPMSVQLPLADFNLGRSRPPPVADAGRRMSLCEGNVTKWQGVCRLRRGKNDTRADKAAPKLPKYATICHSVWSLVQVQQGEPKKRAGQNDLLFFFLYVNCRLDLNRTATVRAEVFSRIYVAKNNLNGCFLVRGRLLRQVQQGEPHLRYPNLLPIGSMFGFVVFFDYPLIYGTR